MEMTKKNKKIIGISIGVGVVGLITAVGYYYYRKPKELESDKLHKGIDPYDELGYDEIEQIRLPKLITGDSRWRDIDARYEDLNNYRAGRGRFTVYSKDNDFNDNSSLDGKIHKRFKILEKDEVVIPRTGRLRTSGERYKHTASGYNFNRNNLRNPNFSDLIIP